MTVDFFSRIYCSIIIFSSGAFVGNGISLLISGYIQRKGIISKQMSYVENCTS